MKTFTLLLFLPFIMQAQTYKAVYNVSFKADDPMANRLISTFKSHKVVVMNAKYSLAYSKTPPTKTEHLTVSTSSSSTGASVDFLVKSQLNIYGIDTTAKKFNKIVYLKKIEPKFRILKEKDTIMNGKTYTFLKTVNESGESITNYYFDPKLPQDLMPYSMPLGDKAPKGGVYKVERMDLDNPSMTTITATLKSIKRTKFDFEPYLKIIENSTVTDDKIKTRRF